MPVNDAPHSIEEGIKRERSAALSEAIRRIGREPIAPENGGWEAEVRTATMDAVRSCEFLADQLRKDGYSILRGDLDV